MNSVQHTNDQDLTTNFDAPIKIENREPPKLGKARIFFHRAVLLSAMLLAGCGAASAVGDDSTDDVRTDGITDVSDAQPDGNDDDDSDASHAIPCKNDGECASRLSEMVT